MLNIATGKSDQCRQGEHRGGGPQCDDHADEADENCAPAPPSDLLLQKERGKCRHVDRRCKIERYGVGERQVCYREEEHQRVRDRQENPKDLQSRPRRGEYCPALAPQERRQNEHRGERADDQHLPERIGAEQPLAQRIVAAEQEHAEQHQADAGEVRRLRCHANYGGASKAGSRRAAICSRQKM
jgi:hypothetical protein